MAGSSGHDFTGTFLGQGYTLTFNYGTAGTPSNEDYIAPFRYVDNATISGLHVSGNIYTSHVHAGGIIGLTCGTTTVTDCRSSVNIVSSKDGDGTYGGILACTWSSSTTSIEDCLFDGSIQSTSGKTDQCDGFVGWRNDIVNVTNCLLTADLSTIGSNDSYTFVRRSDGTGVTVTNCYYTQALGTVQGKAYNFATAPANISTAGEAYSVSGITPYTRGLLYDGRYYMTPEAVNLADNATNDVASKNGYFADVTLSGRTLWKDGDWNTLCLPFDVTVGSGQMSGATAMTLNASQSSFDSDGGVLTLNFTSVASGSTIEAGTPFIVKWTGDNVISPVFSGVTVSSTTAGSVVSEDGNIRFQGTYSPTVIYSTAHNNLYLGADNTLY